MKSNYLMKGLAVMAMGFVAVSCNKMDSFNPYAEQEIKQEEFTNNFQSSVLNGKSIDANQTWATTTLTTLNISSEIAEGTLKVYTTNPSNDNTAPIYIGTISKGEKKTITVTRPSDIETLYVVVYDAENYMRYETVDITSNNLNVSFESSNQVSNAPARRTAGQTFPSSHTFLSAPGASYYAESVPAGVAYMGDLTDPWGGHQIYHYTVYTFWIDAAAVAEAGSMKLQPGYGNQPTTTYIVGTVYSPEYDNKLYLTAGSKLYLTKGSKLVLPSGDYSFSQSDVEIIIAEGAELVCSGKLQFSNTILYNNGTVTTQKLEFAGSGKVYNDAKGVLNISDKLTIANNNCEVVNDGTLNAAELQVNGSGHFMNNNKATITGDAVVNSNNNSWVNNGTFHCKNFLYNGGGSYNVINNCKLICDEDFLIAIGQGQGEFKLDGSIECKNFTHGIGYTKMAGKSLIKVSETLLCKAMADGAYCGFYGPESNANGYAVIQAKKITAETLTQRRSITYRNYLIVATDDHWEQCDKYDNTVNGNYPYWDQGDNVKMSLKNKNDITETITPTDCNAGITGQQIVINDPVSYVYYAFEDLGTTDDFDFNDVVIRVSTPINGTSSVELMAAGGTLSTYVTYGTGDSPNTLGGEVHQEFGVETGVMVNTGKGETKGTKVLGTIQGLSADTDMSNLPLGIKVNGYNGQVTRVVRSAANTGNAPLVIVVNGYASGENVGKWFWATEKTNISSAYNQFGEWGADVSKNQDWYKNISGSVYRW